MVSDQVITSFGFIKNNVDQFIYLNVSGSTFIFLVLYADDIVLASNDVGILHDTKEFLTNSFHMSDLGEIAFELGLEFVRNKSCELLGFISEILYKSSFKSFTMQTHSPNKPP